MAMGDLSVVYVTASHCGVGKSVNVTLALTQLAWPASHQKMDVFALAMEHVFVMNVNVLRMKMEDPYMLVHTANVDGLVVSVIS
jgi:hypothetical protein